VDWAEALLLGILQGLTEWLPVSSSGHLALAQHFFGDVPLVVDILLHFGTLVVLLVFFRKEALMLGGATRAALADLARGKGWEKSVKSVPERRLAYHILLALAPTAVLALSFRFYFGNSLFSNLAVVAAGFAVSGAVLAATWRTGTAPKNGTVPDATGGGPRGRTLEELGPGDSLRVGLAQGVAFLPGFSRSGLTIGTGLLTGMEGETAGRYSFLISLPAVLGAMLLELPSASALPADQLLMALVATAVASVVGYASLGLLMRLLKKGGVHWFAPYCFLLCGFTIAVVMGVF